MKRTSLWIGAAAAGLALAGPAAAQFLPGGGPAMAPPAAVPGLGGGFAPGAVGGFPGGLPGGRLASGIGAGGANPFGSTLANPYGAINNGQGYLYANPYQFGNFDPYGGYLRGGADVVNAQGRFMVARQESKILQAEAERKRIENSRLKFDTDRYIRENTPTPEQRRQEGLKIALSRALNDPPATEVASGDALNTLLNSLEGMANRKTDAAIPLDEDLLKRVNVTKGAGGGSLGALRDEGKLAWPTGLRDLAPADDTAGLAKTLDSLAAEAYAQAVNGRVDPAMLRKMSEITTRMNERLARSANDMPFQQYQEGRKFLRDLEDAVGALSKPDAGQFLTGRAAARGRNAQELVRYMAEKGLRFAPATAGDEASYRTLHRALVNLHNALAPAEPAAPRNPQ